MTLPKRKDQARGSSNDFVPFKRASSDDPMALSEGNSSESCAVTTPRLAKWKDKERARSEIPLGRGGQVVIIQFLS